MSDEVYLQISNLFFAVNQSRYTDGHRLKSLRLQSEVFFPEFEKDMDLYQQWKFVNNI